MKSFVSGYIGGDTKPPCTPGVCWYIYESPFAITDDMLNKFVVPNLKSNARMNNLSADYRYRYSFFNKGSLTD